MCMAKFISRNTALKLIAQPHYKRKVHIPFGDTEDIIFAIKQADKESQIFTTKFAPLFLDSNLLATCKNIFDFVYTQILYKIDNVGEQVIKSPSQTVFTGFADCKSFSLLIGSILKNLKIPFVYRFTTYSKDRAKNKLVSHVYVVVKDKNQEIIIDAVWGIFNNEKPYLYKKDIMPEISYIAGIPRQRVSNAPKNAVSPFADISVGFVGFGDSEPEIGRIKFKNPVKKVQAVAKKAVARVVPRAAQQAVTRVAVKANKVAAKAIPSNVQKVANRATQTVKKQALRANQIVKQTTDRVNQSAKKATQVVNRATATAGKAIKQAVKVSAKGVKQASRASSKGVKQALRTTGKAVKQAGMFAGKTGITALEKTRRFNPLNVTIRGAVEALLRLNAFGMSTKLGYGYMSKNDIRAKGYSENDANKFINGKEKLVKFWENILGGYAKDLEKMTMFGFRKKALLGAMNSAGIGVLPAAIAAPLAAAAPFIALFEKLFGALKKAQKIVQTVKEAIPDNF